MPDSPKVDPVKEPEGNPPDFDAAGSVALQRLIEEVRNENVPYPGQSTPYNRTYHRHNR